MTQTFILSSQQTFKTPPLTPPLGLQTQFIRRRPWGGGGSKNVSQTAKTPSKPHLQPYRHQKLEENLTFRPPSPKYMVSRYLNTSQTIENHRFSIGFLIFSSFAQNPRFSGPRPSQWPTNAFPRRQKGSVWTPKGS